MKPKTKKKDATENESGSSIQNYFQTASKELIQEKGCTASNSKTVYIQALKDQLKSYDGETENESVTNETDLSQETDTVALASEFVDGNKTKTSCDDKCEWRKKYEELKKAHIKLSLRHSDLLMKHDELLTTATSDARTINVEVSDVLASSDNIFTENEIRYLQSLPLDKKKDSSFILQCIQYAYKENASSLLGKTLKGTLERIEMKDDGGVTTHPAKDPLTPEKVKRIEQLFIARVSKSKCLAVEFGERIKQTNINKLIATAIKNVSNKTKPNEKNTNQNIGLDL